MTEAATALAQAGQALRDAARAHKRSEFMHRKQARELMRALDHLRQQCAAHGVALDIDGEAQEARPHDPA